jgi:hypothetical protein
MTTELFEYYASYDRQGHVQMWKVEDEQGKLTFGLRTEQTWCSGYTVEGIQDVILHSGLAPTEIKEAVQLDRFLSSGMRW